MHALCTYSLGGSVDAFRSLSKTQTVLWDLQTLNINLNMDPFSISIAAVGITGNCNIGYLETSGDHRWPQDTQEDLDKIRAQLENIRRSLEAIQSVILDANEGLKAATKQAPAKTGMADAVNDYG